jgi:hypothetical protein
MMKVLQNSWFLFKSQVNNFVGVINLIKFYKKKNVI